MTVAIFVRMSRRNGSGLETHSWRPRRREQRRELGQSVSSLSAWTWNRTRSYRCWPLCRSWIWVGTVMVVSNLVIETHRVHAGSEVGGPAQSIDAVEAINIFKANNAGV